MIVLPAAIGVAHSREMDRGFIEQGIFELHTALKIKRKAPEKVGHAATFPDTPSWRQDRPLLEWLSALLRQRGHPRPSGTGTLR